jgi:CRP-like cAMP-binding protein
LFLSNILSYFYHILSGPAASQQPKALFQSYQHSVAIDLCNYCTLHKYQPGEVIYSEGDVSDACFIVLQGWVCLTGMAESSSSSSEGNNNIRNQEFVDGNRMPIGSIFGQEGVHRKRVRTATVTAIDGSKHPMNKDILLARIDLTAYNKILYQMRDVIIARRIKFLRKLPFFQVRTSINSRGVEKHSGGLTYPTLVRLAHEVSEREFPANKTIVQRGDPADSLFFLVTG